MIVSSSRMRGLCVCLVLCSVTSHVFPSTSTNFFYSDGYCLPSSSKGLRKAAVPGSREKLGVLGSFGTALHSTELLDRMLSTVRLRGGSNAEGGENEDEPPRPPIDDYPPPSEEGDFRPNTGRGGYRDDRDIEDARHPDHADSWRNVDEYPPEGDWADRRRGSRSGGYRRRAGGRDRGYGGGFQDDDRNDDGGIPPPPQEDRYHEGRPADHRDPRDRSFREGILHREYERAQDPEFDRRAPTRPPFDDYEDSRRPEKENEPPGGRQEARDLDRAARPVPYLPRGYDYEERRRSGRFDARGPPSPYDQRSRYDRPLSPPRFSRGRERDPRDRDPADRDRYRSYGRGRAVDQPPYERDAYWSRDRTPSIPKDRRYPDPRAGEPVSLLIRNLSRSTTAETLRQVFNRFGRILDVYIPRSYYKGIPRGFAFVEFENYLDCKAALRSYDGTRLDGRVLSICYAQMNRKSSGEMRRRNRQPRHPESYKRPRLDSVDEGGPRDNRDEFPPPPRPGSTEPFSRSVDRRAREDEDAYRGPDGPDRDDSPGRGERWRTHEEAEARAWRDVEGPGGEGRWREDDRDGEDRREEEETRDREHGEEQESHDRDPPAPENGGYSEGQREQGASEHHDDNYKPDEHHEG
uniref:RRM domain-containing protein n=1 Tax=Guillardia theta TaxID=55529 RepID=A0A7S4KUW8_GUITH|mmetsp:Transcript_31090/g.99789  ORF Transcript_31090/g.99789 Transcript_31090/m.99789 type:complete len:634 (+) Transcript_31090:60-1961(+)